MSDTPNPPTTTSPGPGPTTPDAKPRRSPLRQFFRFLGVLLVIGVLLLVAVLGVVQIVLWSDLPRQIVVEQVQGQLGLDVQIQELHVGWLGETRLEGLTVTLPLKNQPVLEVPSVAVEHNALPMLVATQALRLDSLVIDGPTLHLRQDPQGDWNLVELLDQLNTRLNPGTDAGDTGGGGGVPDLPAIRITGATVTVERPGLDGTAVFRDASVVAGSAGPGAYTAAASAPDLGEATLELLPGGEWRHIVKFKTSPSGPTAEALRVAGLEGTIPAGSISANGTLRGRAPQGGDVLYRGELELEEAASPWGSASGTVSLKVANALPPAATGVLAAAGGTPASPPPPAAAGPVVTIVPQSLKVRDVAALEPYLGSDPPDEAGEVELTGGSIVLAAGTGDVGVDLIAQGLGGRASIEASGNLDTQTGNASVIWADWGVPVLEGWDLRHGGSILATADRTRLGERRITAKLTSRGTSSNGDWDAALSLEAQGPQWASLEGTADLERVEVVYDRKRYALPPLAVDVVQRGQAVLARNLRLTAGGGGGNAAQDASISGGVAFDTSTQTWLARFEGSGLPLPENISAVPIDLIEIRLAGDMQGAQIERARVAIKAAVIEARGRYAVGGIAVEGREPDPPLYLDVDVKELPVGVFSRGEPVLQAENLEGRLRVRGSLDPLAMGAAGRLTARGLQAKGNDLGDLVLDVTAKADGERASFETEEFQAMGGRFNLNGRFLLRPRDARERARRIRVSLAGRDVDLSQLAEMTGEEDGLGGNFGFSFMMTAPGVDVADATGSGTFRLSRFTRQPLVVDELFGELALEEGMFIVREVQGSRLGGRVEDGRVELPLATLLGQADDAAGEDGDVLKVQGRIADWPVEQVDPTVATAKVDATADVGVHLNALAQGNLDALGTVDAVATVYGPRQPLNPADADAPPPQAEPDPYARGTLPQGVADPADPPVPMTPLGEPLAVAKVGLELRGSTVAMTRLDTALSDGGATGTASLDLADPLLQSRADLDFHDIPADLVALWMPDVDYAHGHLGGTLRYGPAWDPRPRGQMQLELLIRSDAAALGEVQLQNRTMQLRGDKEAREYAARVDAFVSLEKPDHSDVDHPGVPLYRGVIERATLYAADGELSMFGRISERINPDTDARERWFYLNPRIEGLSLEPPYATLTDVLISTGDADAPDPDRGAIVGLLDADIRLSGQLPDVMLGPLSFLEEVRQKSFGRGNMQITQSNLGEIPLFSGLFRLLSFSQGGPSATVDSAFRVEQGVFVFERFQYQAPGISLRLYGRVENVFLGLQSPLTGYAIASASPLPDIEGVSALNEAFAAFAGDLTSFNLDGTLEEPQIAPRALEGIFGSIGSMVAPKRGSQEEREAARERQRAFE